MQERIPIYLGAVGPRAIEQAGAIADGWLPFMLDPEQLALIARGAESAGRALRGHRRRPVLPLAVADDVAAARDQVRPWLAFYLGAMGAPSKNFYVEAAERNGHGDSARAVQERFLAGDRAGAAAALSDAMIDEAAIAVTPDGLEDARPRGLRRRRDDPAGAAHGPGQGRRRRALAEVGARVGG